MQFRLKKQSKYVFSDIYYLLNVSRFCQKKRLIEIDMDRKLLSLVDKNR